MATTKQDLIDNLSKYDKSTLERLTKYAELMLIPQADMLVSVTADQMVNKAHQLADIFFPEWTDRGKADFGEFLVELMANFSEKDFWYLNGLANETLLENMSIYSNGYSRALSLGYLPQNICNALYKYRINFVADSNDITIPIGKLVIEAANTVLSFTNSNPIFVSKNGGVVDVTLINGKFNEENINYNGKEIRLTKENIDKKYISLESGNDLWIQVNTFSESSPTDKVFLVLPNEDGSQRIKFSGGDFGVEPSLGETFKVLYNYGDSTDANNLPLGTSYIVKETPRTILGLTQISQVVQAKEQESLSSIKINAPLYFRTRGRLLNLTDVIEYLESLDSVVKAQALATSSDIYFYIVPTSETNSIEEQKLLNELQASMTENPILGFNIYGTLTDYVNLNYDLTLPIPSQGLGGITLTAFALQGSNLEAISEEIKSLIQRFTDPRGDVTKYGNPFKLIDLSNYLISNVEGLQNVVYTSIAGITASSLVNGEILLTDNQILAKILLENINLTTQYSV